MNYFELFDIPVQLKIDQKILPLKYFELSRKYHPDYFVNQDSSTQQDTLEMSAQLNRAYKTFRDPDETIRYVLQLKQLIEEEEKYALPPDFLMEVMEINEEIMDNETASKNELLKKVESLRNDIYEPVKPIIEGYKEGLTTEAELLKVKEYYYKKKYLHRITQQLEEKV